MSSRRKGGKIWEKRNEQVDVGGKRNGEFGGAQSKGT
jgi:hypothetical protein